MKQNKMNQIIKNISEIQAMFPYDTFWNTAVYFGKKLTLSEIQIIIFKIKLTISGKVLVVKYC